MLEVQLDRDPTKAWAFLSYLSSVWRELGCTTWVMLFSPHPGVISWARDDLYPRRPELAPVVVTPDLIPKVTTVAEALRDIAWAVLSVVAHGRGPHAVDCAVATIEAILTLAPPDHTRYLQLVLDSVGERDMNEVRNRISPELEELLSEWERTGYWHIRSRAEGIKEGIEQGLERGLGKVVARR